MQESARAGVAKLADARDSKSSRFRHLLRATRALCHGCVTLALLLVVAAPAGAGDFDAPPTFAQSIRLNPWHVAAVVTDLASSEAMEANGWLEVNLLTPDTTSRIAAAAIEVALVATVSGWFESRGHRTTARLVRWVPVVLRFLVSLWNSASFVIPPGRQLGRWPGPRVWN